MGVRPWLETIILSVLHVVLLFVVGRCRLTVSNPR